ncbi:MFS transporter [Jeongeupia naejangsanensis]|uniref:Multidrug transporter MdfA n=1 Tax=Jeongeupia naejangsanensis TaxID=613195 RepID=A0ABS2BFD2_9NEIS|nr:MFS transporter [Jeongeupia naejangsanensis]MBM3114317.1 MFS transporter [Jeongeupia naejangsanensis]
MNAQPISRLTWRTMLFPISLVLFEFSTYVANDMILPGMLQVVHEFNAPSSLVPTALAAYLAGGAALQWLLGPLSDRIGRRPLMLFGVAAFIVLLLLTLPTSSIGQFMVLRFFQGMGLCFVTAIGYASIQEAFTETAAVKVMALMANVALLAPLVGPVAGAALIEVAPWRTIFVLIAITTSISLLGLWRTMPETAKLRGTPFNVRSIAGDYRKVFTNRRFVCGALAIGAASLPLLTWIGQAPVILMERAQMTPLAYGLWQIPIFAALIAGNLTLARMADRVPITRMIKFGLAPVMAGLTLAAIAMLIDHTAVAWLVAGISLCAFGAGLANAALYRLTLFSSQVSKGTVAASLGMITMLLFTIGIEIVRWGYAGGGNVWFACANFVVGIGFCLLVHRFLSGDDTPAAGT